jgi:hypothetical protein
MSTEGVSEPIGNVVTSERHVVRSDVLDSSLALREYLQFPTGAVGELIERLMRILQPDLPIVRAVRNQERHFDAIEDTVQMHSLSLTQEIVHILRAENPPDVTPVVGHGVFPFPLQALLLNLRPIVIGAPDGATGESRLECHCTGRKVATERDANHTDALWIHV